MSAVTIAVGALDRITRSARTLAWRTASNDVPAYDRLPPFPVTTVGSWPRPPRLRAALLALRTGQLSSATFNQLADDAVRDFVQQQEQVGVDIVSDGELRREDFCSFIGPRLDGVQVVTLSENHDMVTGLACVGRLARREPLAVHELRFVQACTPLPIKVTLPGPYLLSRLMFVPGLTRAYESEEELASDVVHVLREELHDLACEGAAFVQFDEPALAELVFARGQTCIYRHDATLVRRDLDEELEFAASLMNRVVDGVTRVRTGVHVCRGNSSRNESELLSGTYRPLAPYFERLHVKQLILEYATYRAGDFVAFPDKEIGLGVVNPRLESIETPAEIRRAVERALPVYPPESLFLNPDCGVSAFADRPLVAEFRALAKLQSIVEAARQLRARMMPVPALSSAP